MLAFFVTVLAASGAAFVLQGREMRGLLVILTANVAVGLVATGSARWGWLAFSCAMSGICVLGMAVVRNADPEPQPAPEEPERDPDWCWAHKQLEPKEER